MTFTTNLNYGFEIARACEAAAITAARRQGFGNSLNLLKEAREALVRNINSRNAYKINIINDRFQGHSFISPFPSVLGNPDSAEEVEATIVTVDGHKVTAHGGPNAATYMALAPKGTLQVMPNVYMNKIAVGPEAYGAVNVDASPAENVKKLARVLKKYIDNITVVFLDRQRNLEMIHEVRSCGARIQLIQDGDISAALATVFSGKVDMVMGYGGAQEGVLDRSGDEMHREKIEQAGVTDPEKIYDINDLVKGNQVVIAGTGISDGYFLEGVRFEHNGAHTNSFVARGETKTFRNIKTRHYFDYKEIM
ncbi:hypothetical protein CHS0354_002051 [Potamilus streckersoni]|uniref:Fructose-bisphosphatase n=1 Tax=Potamilus streckersoni TaxID=2493646 RepID=A0AAE0W6T1_9BIVA|nr:hypothetical protein CHS0354_002051 [Potamilus streckersoni]